MLTIHKITLAAAPGYADYLTAAERGHGDYYLDPRGDPAAPEATWLGAIAAQLGLTEVTAGDLAALLQGCDPRTGELLVRLGANGAHVAAHDLTFSAPSSVSAAWALADDELRAAIEAAHSEAVLDAFRHIESTFPLVRRRDRITCRIVTETAASLLGARFLHHTARRTETQVALGFPPDPQLHTHLLLLMARRHDSSLVALNSLTLFRRRREAGALYRAALAARLAALGLPIERRTGSGGQYFELDGIPQELRDLWSSRHGEIVAKGAEWREQFRAAFGRDPTLVEERAWAAKTRARKGRYHRGQLLQHWREQARLLGIADDIVTRLRADHSTLPPIEAAHFRLMAELLSPDGVTSEHATFDHDALRLAAYLRAPGLLAPTDVEETIRRLLRRGDVIEIAPGIWTTGEMRELERQVLTWKETQWTRAAPVGGEMRHPDVWRQAVERCPVQLSTEQQAAVEALRTGSGFTAVVGEAGTGKGIVLGVAAAAWRAEGRRVLAVAISGGQARRLQAELGEGTSALTVDALVHRLRDGRLTLGREDVLAIDEAGQIDTRRWAALAGVLAGANAPQVVAIGDEAQLSPIGAGGLWPHLSRDAVRLTEVRRTTLDWERDAWACVRRGESREALQLYGQHRRLHLHATRAEAIREAVRAWDGDGRRGLIVTDASNRERHEANRAAQDRRREREELGEMVAAVATPSGIVQLRGNDRVIFKGSYPLAAGPRVENGTTATVVGAGAGGTICIRTDEANPRELTLPARWDGGWLDLHYAAHVATAQGTTVPTAYVVAGGWQTHRESLYVQLSRSREGSHLFVDRESLDRDLDADALHELVRRGGQSRAKVAAAAHERGHCTSRRPSRSTWLRQAIAVHLPREEVAHAARS